MRVEDRFQREIGEMELERARHCYGKDDWPGDTPATARFGGSRICPMKGAAARRAPCRRGWGPPILVESVSVTALGRLSNNGNAVRRPFPVTFRGAGRT